MVDVKTEQNKKLKKINEKKILTFIVKNNIKINEIRNSKNETFAIFPVSKEAL